MIKHLASLLVLLLIVVPIHAEIVIAEGESFQPKDDKGWKVTHQNDTYGSHSYGGMWMTHGGCLGAPADSVGSVAVKNIRIPESAQYRIWSKYQAPPYFHYRHKVEIVQGGKTVFSHVYGNGGTDRLWSFSGTSDELWWPWGVDHDAAEPSPGMVNLKAGAAEMRLITVENDSPAGERFVDFLVLTTNPKIDYIGYKPYRVGSPFTNEAFAASKVYMRFKNASNKAAQLQVSRAGHYQPNYGGARTAVPDKAVAPGQWSPWVNIGPFCRLVHDEGLFLSLDGANVIQAQFARDASGKDIVGDVKVKNGSAVSVPLTITWDKTARVKTSEELARGIIAASKKWKKANGGRRPKKILFYGAFRGKEPWIPALKSALGYNTLLPDNYEHVHRDGMHTHAFSPQQIEAVAKRLTDKSSFRIMSFGDEISLGRINFNDPKLQDKFRQWLVRKKVTSKQLGVNPNQAKLTNTGDPRLVWYSNLFNQEERFAIYRERTQLTKRLIGKDVLTGANYSPHHGVLYYGSLYQWIDIFKQNGMSMFWAEDYIFSVPEVPQIISFQFAQIRCATKYNNQPIHYYVMPHSPGQEPDFFRRNVLLSIGYGTDHIDNFWIGPEENFTENYVSWNYPKMFRAISETIHETAEVEDIQQSGKLRPARVAVILSRATDFNESRLRLPKSNDPFAKRCKNAPKELEQNLCRKDQQMLYLALKNAQHDVDAITEDDIVAGALKNYDVVYFAGEWVDDQAVSKLSDWVKSGGILYASAGLGHKNQFNQSHTAMLNLLGLKGANLQKDLVRVRTLLELPLTQAKDAISLKGDPIPAIGMRQKLTPSTAKVLGTWKDGSAAVTVHELGKGKAFAIGTCAGISWMKTAIKAIPYARGGTKNLYNPVDFSESATDLVRLGVDSKRIVKQVECSVPGVEAIVMDSPKGTLLTLVNWTNAPIKKLEVAVRLNYSPKTVRSVHNQANAKFAVANGVCSFRVDLADADYILLPR